MLNPSGGIEADVTISCLKKNYFRIVCPALARVHNKSHILKNATQEIKFKDVTDDYASLGLFGPNSRKFLTKLVGNFFSKEEFPFATGKYINFLNIKIWVHREVKVVSLVLYFSLRKIILIFFLKVWK